MYVLPLEMAFAVVNSLNNSLSGYAPVMIIAGTMAATVVLQKAYELYTRWDSQQIKKDLTDKTIHVMGQLPYIGPRIQAKINAEVSGMLHGIRADIQGQRAEWEPIATLPEQGLSSAAIDRRFEKLNQHYKPGKLSGSVYAEYDEVLSHLLQKIWSKTALTNPMHTDWPLINLMEAEVISMCQHLLHGENDAPGIMTHGGSTSILEALKAYVLHARSKGISHPEIIVPDTAHIAFEKAATVLNARLIKVPVDARTGAADPRAMERAITGRTCLMVGSAPSFPFGIIDPIETLARIAENHRLPLHVDSCLGGFLTVFANEAGFSIPPCDFSIPGVTSISIDTHKYGQTPKGTSMLLFTKNSPATPTHVHLDWIGGMYVTPGIDGSRSGADIALTWTVMCYKGKEEYVRETKAILDLQAAFVERIQQIEGLIVPYNPKLSVIPIQTTTGIDSFLVAEQLSKTGWSVNIIQGTEQQAPGFHFCLTSIHTHQPDFVENFTSDLSRAVDYAKSHPEEQPHGMIKAYGKLAKGVPLSVQKRIGEGYARILNTLGLWAPAAPAEGIDEDVPVAFTDAMAPK